MEVRNSRILTVVRQVLRTILFLIAVCLLSFPAQANEKEFVTTADSQPFDSAQGGELVPKGLVESSSRYIFLSDQSTVIQTGGIAGVHWIYSVEGQFQLTVDPNAGTALFAHVDANATDESPYRRTLDPNEEFNMTKLVGTVIGDTIIVFSGKAADSSNILIIALLNDDLVYLVGKTFPPAGSADFFIFSLDATAQRKYGGGTGEPNDPYLIYTAEQLNTIGLNQEDADKHFKLMADIDLSAYKGDTFNRIGCYEPPPQFPSGNIPFTGVFDGNGHTISNFTYAVDINEPPYEGYLCEDFVGLFGYVNGPGAQIKNLGLIDPNMYPEATCSERVARVGALAGRLRLGIITNCYVHGGRVLADAYVGGLVGSNLEGTISNCYTTCDVALAEDRWLRPIDDPNIPVVSVGFSFGGLVGYSRGWIYDCYATGSVQGVRASGGLVGINDSDIFNPESDIGVISGSYATGDVSGDEDVGGLVGSNSGEIHQCRAFGNVSGLNSVGGLVGDMVMDEGGISDSYATGDVSGNEQVGGLVGYSNGSIKDSYAISEVSGNVYVGGLAGFNGYGTIYRSYAGGAVSGTENVGGLAGRNGGAGMIHCSYAIGEVLGTEYVGGLAGTNFGTIHCSYSAGAVSGIQKVGGLVGDNWGGGIVTACFWDIETSGLTDMCGIESSGAIGCDNSYGKTTIEMQTESTFLDAGWDFVDETKNGAEDIWWILEGRDYPRLNRELIEDDSAE